MANVPYGRVAYFEEGRLQFKTMDDDLGDLEVDEGTLEELESAAATLPTDMSPRRNKPAPAANAPTKKAAAARETEKNPET